MFSFQLFDPNLKTDQYMKTCFHLVRLPKCTSLAMYDELGQHTGCQ